MQRWRNVRSKSIKAITKIFVIVALAASLGQGCTTNRTAQWYVGDGLVEVSSTDEIRHRFERLFASYSNREDRFSCSPISVGATNYFFVKAYPYHGPGIFSIYCYEQIQTDTWRLRALLPVVGGRSATVSYAVEGEKVQVLYDGRVLLELESISKVH